MLYNFLTAIAGNVCRVILFPDVEFDHHVGNRNSCHHSRAGIYKSLSITYIYIYTYGKSLRILILLSRLEHTSCLSYIISNCWPLPMSLIITSRFQKFIYLLIPVSVKRCAGNLTWSNWQTTGTRMPVLMRGLIMYAFNVTFTLF